MYRLRLDADDMHAVATKVLGLFRLADVAIANLSVAAKTPREGAVVEVAFHGDPASAEKLASRIGQVVGVTNLSLTRPPDAARISGDARRPDVAEAVAWA